MHPTVFIVAVLLLHGVSGHLFQRALPHTLTKHMRLHTRQSDVDECIDKKLEEATRDGTFPSICMTDREAENDDGDDDDDDDDRDLNQLQEEINADFSVFCRPECGNVFLSAADDCGYFDQDDVDFPRDIFIGLCGTNENGDKCYESYVDTLNNTFPSEFFCYLNNFYTSNDTESDDKQCNCRSTLLAEVREKGCCLNLYNGIFEDADDEFKRSELYDACNVDLPTGCNNSPIGADDRPTTTDDSPTTADDSTTTADDSTTTEESGHGVMTQVALVPLISFLIFSVLFS